MRVFLHFVCVPLSFVKSSEDSKREPPFEGELATVEESEEIDVPKSSERETIFFAEYTDREARCMLQDVDVDHHAHRGGTPEKEPSRATGMLSEPPDEFFEAEKIQHVDSISACELRGDVELPWHPFS